MTLRAHSPVTVAQFNGLWRRGSIDETPFDHGSVVNNIQFFGSSEFGTRDGVGITQNVDVPLSNVKRFYNYPTLTGNTVIVLVINTETEEGEIYHVVDSDTVYGPILSLAGMVDFAFVPFSGRAYISPIGYYTITGLDDAPINIEKGLEDEVLYVYAGDGTPARAAAGDAMTGDQTIANGSAGHTDAGVHVFGWVRESISGYLAPPGQLEAFTTAASFSVSFTDVQATADPNIAARHLVATKVIVDYDGNLTGSQLFFVPGATIPNDVDTFLLNVSFFDVDLLEDADYLLDNFTEIPATAVLGLYNNALVIATTFDDVNAGYVSAPGEPEAINQIDGLLNIPPDSNPLTNAQELRSVLYMFKRNRTIAFINNGDVPATWQPNPIDAALGASLHGIGTVLDSGSANVDALIVANYKGINYFNGSYAPQELTWKEQDLWLGQNRNLFRLIQIVNDATKQRLLVVLPDGTILEGNYANGMSAKNMRFGILTFARNINTIAIVNIDQIILGMDLL